MATHSFEDKFRDPDTRARDTWLSFGLAFVGGHGDAAIFVLAKPFRGHVTGNLVLGAIALAAHDWRASLGHLSAIVGAGAAMVFHFKVFGMLGAALMLTALVLREVQSGGSHIERDDAARN